MAAPIIEEIIYTDWYPVFDVQSKEPQEVIDFREGKPLNVANPMFHTGVLSGLTEIHDLEAIKNALLNLFLIQQGEVPGKPKIGNPLIIKVFDLFDSFTEKTIEASIINIVEKYEPRVNIEKVKVTLDPEFNRIIVIIDFTAIINNRIIGDTIYIPFAHNTKSYIGNRYTKTI